MFFNTHRCNEYCSALGLVNPRIVNELPPNFKLIAYPYEGKSLIPSQIISKLCDLCRYPFKTIYGKYCFQREKEFELWCDSCTWKRDNSMKEAICKDCRNPFHSSTYWYMMKKSDFPESCYNCRLALREKLRAKLEGKIQHIESE